MFDTNIQIVDMKVQNQNLQKQLRLRKLQTKNWQLFAKLNLKIQISMIDAADSSITKLFNVSLIDNNILSSTNITTTIVSITTNAGDVAITTSSIIFKNKSIKSKMMRVYKNQNINEHVRWFREIDIKYMMSLEYFFFNMIKIVYCMQFLEDDSAVQWYQYVNENVLLLKKIYAKFMTFLFNLITNFINRRFFVYERWKEIKQKSDQKMFAFKTHLKKLKTQLFKFN